MPRAYLNAGARCRQLERLVRTQFALTGRPVIVVDLVGLTGLSDRSVRAYMLRLSREKRVVVVVDDPALGHSAQQLFYPPDPEPARKMKAA